MAIADEALCESRTFASTYLTRKVNLQTFSQHVKPSKRNLSMKHRQEFYNYWRFDDLLRHLLTLYYPVLFLSIRPNLTIHNYTLTYRTLPSLTWPTLLIICYWRELFAHVDSLWRHLWTTLYSYYVSNCHDRSRYLLTLFLSCVIGVSFLSIHTYADVIYGRPHILILKCQEWKQIKTIVFLILKYDVNYQWKNNSELVKLMF